MPIVAIVGRPNVGKSTLFNRIAGARNAIVDDFPGVTRDRNYAQVNREGKSFTLVDTAGFIAAGETPLEEQAKEQILLALDEADIILFVADAKTGLHPEDSELTDLLRRTSKPVFFVVNKIDGSEQRRHTAEFYELGVERLYPVSAAHGYGIDSLLDHLTREIPAPPEDACEAEDPGEIRVAVVGRPNVGKSTLVNQILGAPRVMVSPIPGTTRDAVDSPFELRGQRYVLIDTAGIRRKGKTRLKLEKLSIIKALQSIEKSHVAIVMVDAGEGVTDQDLHVAGYIQERFRGCIIGINKWDTMESDPKRTRQFLRDVRDRFRFLPFAPLLTFSAETGLRVSKIVPTVREVFQQYNQRITTGIVNRALEQTLQKHEPPQVGRRRLKFYYATQASVRPPTFVLFCNYPEAIHFSYERFLLNQFREAFGLDKSPIRILFRGRRREEKNE